MAGHVSNSHLAKLSFTVSRPRIPVGWRYMLTLYMITLTSGKKKLTLIFHTLFLLLFSSRVNFNA